MAFSRRISVTKSNKYSLAIENFDQKFVAQTKFKPDTFQMLGLNKLWGKCVNVPTKTAVLGGLFRVLI